MLRNPLSRAKKKTKSNAEFPPRDPQKGGRKKEVARMGYRKKIIEKPPPL